MSCTSISTRYAEGCGITIAHYPHPVPLGKLAWERMRTERERLNNGCERGSLPLGEGWGEG